MTTEHLPECSYTPGIWYSLDDDCICDALRACEQRVNDEWVRDYGGHRAFALGVQAAREAVVALTPRLDVEKYKGGYDCCGCSTTYDLMEDALAAIDALRGES